MNSISLRGEEGESNHGRLDRHSSKKRTPVSMTPLEFGTTFRVTNTASNLGNIFDGSFEHASELWCLTTSSAGRFKVHRRCKSGSIPTKALVVHAAFAMTFQVRTNPDSINVSQLVAVRLLLNTSLSFTRAPTSSKTGSAPRVRVVDGSGAELVSTPHAPNGTSDWNKLQLQFKD